MEIELINLFTQKTTDGSCKKFFSLEKTNSILNII